MKRQRAGPKFLSRERAWSKEQGVRGLEKPAWELVAGRHTLKVWASLPREVTWCAALWGEGTCGADAITAFWGEEMGAGPGWCQGTDRRWILAECRRSDWPVRMERGVGKGPVWLPRSQMGNGRNVMYF